MPEKEKDLETLGEFGLIDLITNDVKLKNETSVVGVGDDAAVIDCTGYKTVVTTDMLTEGVHFDLIYTPLKHLGYKAVIVNLSDVYAMNAQPKQVLVSIAVSAKFTANMIEELYEGIKLACDYYKVDLIGGDTTSSMTGLTISITAIGIAEENKLTYRNGAKPNDLLCVSGDLGGAFLGLQLLEREKRVYTESSGGQPDLTGFDYILERQLKPEARHDIIEKLEEISIVPTSMIDISDGLSSEAIHISNASGVGVNIYAERVPLAPETKQAADELGLEPVTMALNGGEDYELLFTVAIEHHEKVAAMEGISIIGHVTEDKGACYLVASDNSAIELKAMGWDSISEQTKNGDA